MELRHEWKHSVNAADVLALRQRLRCIMQPDPHAPQGVYTVRSLYFDDGNDTVLREKLEGVFYREKFRIRYYNDDLSMIRLEKKSKWGELGNKRSAVLSRQETEALLRGDLAWMRESGRDVVVELYHRMTAGGLRPRTIVDYTREPFVFPAGNVRVTIDRQIRTGLGSTDFLDAGCVTIPVEGDPTILEVKWDDFLPDIIRCAVQLEGRRTTAFSKYAACRMYD